MDNVELCIIINREDYLPSHKLFPIDVDNFII